MTAQVRRVDPDKTINFEIAGATAAYTLDSFFAEAVAENGMVSLTGKQPGITHIVVITPAGTQTIEILVTMRPPNYPAGFVMPNGIGDDGQTGYYEGRYYSSPAQFQNQIDFLKVNGDNRTHVHIVETTLTGPLDPGQSRVALSSATYQILTERRDITLFDKYVDESQLTINGAIVRGFHLRQDGWFVHAGYTSVATFEGLFLPIQPELVVGGGYRYNLTLNSSITASFYHISIPSSDRLGQSGSIGALSYKYQPRESFWFTVDGGISHGIGGAGRLYYHTDRDNIVALARYMPLDFAALGANNLRGVHSDIAWTHHLTKNFEANLTFYNNNLVLPGIRENTIAGGINLRYQITRHWALTGGAIASRFENKLPPGPTVRNFTLPVGFAFQSLHFGATAQYQFAVSPGVDSGGKQYRASLRSGWGRLTLTAYGERDTNAPTLNFIYTQLPGLQQILDQLAIKATSIQQVDELLSSNSFLIAAGYIKGATINLVPVRTQAGGSADWSGGGIRKRHLTYSFLFNDNQMLHGSTEDVAHTLSYSQSVTRRDDLSLACSILGEKNPGQSEEYTPVCFIAWRHQFSQVPYFIIPERHGTISGNVFHDDQSKGAFEAGMKPMAEVEVTLDGRRRTFTKTDGTYSFIHVPRGKHTIAAIYSSRDPFFFTTPASAEVDENGVADFGIGYSLSAVTGLVLNDAGQGIPGVIVVVQNREVKKTATTDGDGGYFVSSVAAGEYNVDVEEDSLPPGYSSETLGQTQHATVGATSPGKADFTVRAYRSIAGHVLRYDPKAAKYVPVSGAEVSRGKDAPPATTDAMGRYLFRDLAAGVYTLWAQSGVQASSRTIRVGGPPVDLLDVDFQITGQFESTLELRFFR